MSDLTIGPYARRPAEVDPSDHRASEVASRVAGLIHDRRPDLVGEHVGSTAVPGLPGKGVVDLLVPADPDDIPAITRDLLEMGFQPQGGRSPWPPTRPMLIGSVEHDGTTFRLHCHVVPDGSSEIAELRRFRDALRADPQLRDDYAAAKDRIAGSGGVDPITHAIVKGVFVEEAMFRIGAWSVPTDADGSPIRPVPPGSTIGILGGGQLGRMLGFAARALGYRVAILDPDPDCPARAIADRHVVAPYDDLEGALELAEGCAVVTYELEHVAADVVEELARRVPVRPGLTALRATQDRLAERRFLRSIGELTAPWREVRGSAELGPAAAELGFPLRLKVPLGGYDGRSQVRIANETDLRAALAALGRGGDDDRPLLLERELAFERELSVVCARGADGRTVAFPAARNVHDDGILVESVAPAPMDPALIDRAQVIAGKIARELDVVGTVTVELFLVEGNLFALNELAPRVHNSGHYTIEACRTSQFEQHIRAICGLPLGSPEQLAPAAMVNLLGAGSLRASRLEGLDRALTDPLVHVHVYDKRRVFERRKMGHVTVTSANVDDALDRARRALRSLTWADAPTDPGSGR